MNETPRLSTVVILGLTGTLFLCVVIFQKEYPSWAKDWARPFLILAAALCLIAAGLMALDFLGYEFAARLEQINKAASITERTRLAGIVQQMNGDQINVLRFYFPSVIALAGNIGPNVELRAGLEKIPYWWIKDFIKESPVFLKPIRSFGNGSTDQNWAIMLTTWLVLMDYADPAAGPNSAGWKKDSQGRPEGRDRALVALGIRPAEVKR